MKNIDIIPEGSLTQAFMELPSVQAAYHLWAQSRVVPAPEFEAIFPADQIKVGTWIIDLCRRRKPRRIHSITSAAGVFRSVHFSNGDTLDAWLLNNSTSLRPAKFTPWTAEQAFKHFTKQPSLYYIGRLCDVERISIAVPRANDFTMRIVDNEKIRDQVCKSNLELCETIDHLPCGKLTPL